MHEFKTLQTQRELIHRLVSPLGKDELLAIPACRRNNIAWNLGHIVTVQQALCNLLSGKRMNLPDEYRAWYLRDTSPADWTGEPDVPKLLDELLALPAQTEADYAAGLFANYQSFTTTTGAVLETVEDAIGFNNFHEGLHTGIILSIRKELAGA
jgi:hypothetical protein